MAKNNLVNLRCFGVEVGRIGFDENKMQSYFQYHPEFTENNQYNQLFPATGIIKRVKQTQVFNQYNSSTFRGLPPPIADSLPDAFGNLIFKLWLESTNRTKQQITILEQLAYVANRGMGALEFFPIKEIPKHSTINLAEILKVLNEVLIQKRTSNKSQFNTKALINIFKLGTSAGGARPKILIAEHKENGQIAPGDITVSKDYKHYIVKLHLENEKMYNQSLVEYCYYKIATQLGIRMMPSRLIENTHFATERFDRQNGQKQHILTATGLTGWDYKLPTNSSYENLFQLAIFLKIPHAQIEELFRRMVFNVVFCNTDDHLKNHTFIYDEQLDRWSLAPAYDLTFAYNPLLEFKTINRALSINGKRSNINKKDFLKLADLFTIKNPKGVIREVVEASSLWPEIAKTLEVEPKIIETIQTKLNTL